MLEQAEVKTFNQYAREQADDTSLVKFDMGGGIRLNALCKFVRLLRLHVRYVV